MRIAFAGTPVFSVAALAGATICVRAARWRDTRSGSEYHCGADRPKTTGLSASQEKRKREVAASGVTSKVLSL